MSNKRSFVILGIEHIGIAMKDNLEISTFLNLLPGIKIHSSEIVKDQMVKTEIYNFNEIVL